MKKNFIPLVNKLYVFDKHCMFMIQSGHGIFQVDFKNYVYTKEKIFFLSPGQSFQLLSGDFIITQYEITQETIAKLDNSRFLFKHIIGLGHIEMQDANQILIKEDVFNIEGFLNTSIEDWITLNPFQTTKENINLLFNVKEIIDEQYKEPINLITVSSLLNQSESYIDSIAKSKLNYSIQKLKTEKQLLEAQRKIVFTNLSTKEIAYESGFNDPNYFNRFFKKQTQLTPLEFRERIDFEERDTFMNNVLELINLNYKQQHSVEFYANKLNLTAKSLSQKFIKKSPVSIKQLISEKLIHEASQMIQNDIPVYAIADELGFQEPNHFTSFFKLNTGKIPTQFLSN